MQSAQVNQMTSSLKDRIELLKKFYNSFNKEEILKKTGSKYTYQDLLSQEDQQFWDELCRKDFKRLDKLQTTNIGEGLFMEDSDEFESDQEKRAIQEPV